MKLKAKETVTLPVLTLLFIILAGTMGWIVVLTELQGHPEGITKELIEIGKEVLKVVVIAGAAAIATEYVLKNLSKSEDDLKRIGITRVFTRRQDANEEFLRCVRDRNTRHITICGISLRDFLLHGGTLYEVWRAICERLKQEYQSSNLPPDRRLHVRLLLLLPNSDEGYFRHAVEGGKQKSQAGIPFDIPQGLNNVGAAQTEIFGKRDVEFLQVRLYEHCPFAFLFATETQIFVEQYDYRDQKDPASMPLVSYQSDKSQYKEQIFSLDVMWSHAHDAGTVEEVGTARAIREGRIKNIFRGEDRSSLTKKQMGAIQHAKEGSIDILAITGKFYTSHPSVARELQRISRPDDPASGTARLEVPVRFAIINPVSQQAILRAIAEGCHPDQVGEQLRNWTWARHQRSNLYNDARSTADTLFNWAAQRGCRIGVRLYSSAVACAILETDNHVFVEQYVYGRSKAFQPGFNLGGEYPVIEYEASKTSEGVETVEQQLISATFQMIWKFFSISWEDYTKHNEQEQFEANLAALRVELGAT